MLTAASVASAVSAVRMYLGKNWLPLFSAFVIGLGLPMWRYSVVEKPALRIEITQVEMDTPAKKLRLRATVPLRPVVEMYEQVLPSAFREAVPDEAALDDLVTAIDRRREFLTKRAKVVEEARKIYDDVRTKPTWSWREARDTYNKIQATADFLVPDPDDLVIDMPADVAPVPVEITSAWLTSLDTGLKRNGESYRSLLEKVTAAQASVDQYRTTLSTSKAQIKVHCAVGNSGGGAISLKPQALLRAHLGGENFIDVRMKIDNYEDSGELEPKGSKILKIASDPLESMSPKDREQIAAYFKGNTPAQLFLMDIENRAYVSNIVPFASGLYDDKVYELLRSAAVREQNQQRSLTARLF